MDPKLAKSQIEALTQDILQHSTLYYQKGESTISDAEFDALMRQLNDLEEQFPEYRSPDSPTQRVGGEPSAQFENVTHRLPMLSLENVYNGQELESWLQDRVKKNLGQEEVKLTCELKIDGFAISIHYKEGRYHQAVTRGNGLVGDDVTENVRSIQSLPKQLKEPVSCEVRGEIYMSHRQFEHLNQAKQAAGEALLKNPRNAAAGAIRLKDPKEVAARGLSIFLYDIVSGYSCQSHQENLDHMERLGLPVTPNRALCSTPQEVLEYCNRWQNEKESLEFDIDGVVIKVDSLPQREELGIRSKSPRWAVAWKFVAERVCTQLLEVTHQVSRAGVITPVANLEAVELLGTTVRRATLHNYDQIRRLDLHERDWVFVEKGGEIIPKIVGIDLERRDPQSTKVEEPDRCPACETRVSRGEDEVELRCDNNNCPAIITGALQHFVSKKGMNIQSLGKKQIETLLNEQWIERIPDIYRLERHRATMMTHSGFGKKSVENMLQAIEESKTPPLNQLIYALGIRNIGEKAAKTVALKAGTLQGFAALQQADLETLSEFGDVMKASLAGWLTNPSNKRLLEELVEVGIVPLVETSAGVQPFLGKSIVITGTLSRLRFEWEKALEAAGFRVASSISKKTDYLLCGAQAGSKLTKAKSLGVKVITEDELQQLLEESAS